MKRNQPNPYLEPLTVTVQALVEEHKLTGWPQEDQVYIGPVMVRMRYEHRHIGEEVSLVLRLVDLQVENIKRRRGRGGNALIALEHAAAQAGIKHLLVEHVVSDVLDGMLLRRGFTTSGSPPLVSYHREVTQPSDDQLMVA